MCGSWSDWSFSQSQPIRDLSDTTKDYTRWMMLMPGGTMVKSQGNRWRTGGVMERDSWSSVWIWESGDPAERADLLPDAGINDFDWAHAHHHIDDENMWHFHFSKAEHANISAYDANLSVIWTLCCLVLFFYQVVWSVGEVDIMSNFKKITTSWEIRCFGSKIHIFRLRETMKCCKNCLD